MPTCWFAKETADPLAPQDIEDNRFEHFFESTNKRNPM